MSKPGFIVSWVEHIWTRMRRLDYWNDHGIASHYPMKYYRAISPGSQPPAEVPVSEPYNVYNIRYFPRDRKRKDVSYYPDTPLSMNHAVMKGMPQRPTDDPSITAAKIPAFDGTTSGQTAMWRGKQIAWRYY